MEAEEPAYPSEITLNVQSQKAPSVLSKATLVDKRLVLAPGEKRGRQVVGEMIER